MKFSAALNSLHRGSALAASIACGHGDSLAWVGVYPLDISRETTLGLLERLGQPKPRSGEFLYRVRRFEVAKCLIESDASISERDLQRATDIFAYGDEGLEEALRQLDLKIEDLTLPYKSNYPI
jgi:hypothetical protein